MLLSKIILVFLLSFIFLVVLIRVAVLSLNKLLHVRTTPGTTKHKIVVGLRTKLLNIAPKEYKEQLVSNMLYELKQLDKETLEAIKKEYILADANYTEVVAIIDKFIEQKEREEIDLWTTKLKKK